MQVGMCADMCIDLCVGVRAATMAAGLVLLLPAALDHDMRGGHTTDLSFAAAECRTMSRASSAVRVCSCAHVADERMDMCVDKCALTCVLTCVSACVSACLVLLPQGI